MLNGVINMQLSRPPFFLWQLSKQVIIHFRDEDLQSEDSSWPLRAED